MSDNPEPLNPALDSQASQAPQSSVPTDRSSASYSLLVCQYDNCLRNRSAQVLQALQSIDLPDSVTVEASGCQGQCHLGANVQVLCDAPANRLLRSVWYCGVKPQDAETLVARHCQDHEWIPHLLNPRLHPASE